jgi:CheY-like chemotaxis protein/anti-sigma regulatory factor (Ser/Thr protein kinase)
MQRAIQDVSGTVDRMREFCRPREPQLQLARVELNRLVEQVVSLTRARWSDLPQQRGVVIDLLTDLAVDLPDIMGAEGEIRDALTNLIFNAVDAMPEGGTLTICTRAITADTADAPSADHVRVEVLDTGMGMDEDTRRHCIEPFYTTKGERGTGLGLAMVYGMTQRHSAGLEIESVQGKGTTVRLTFPISTSGWTSTPRLSQTKLPAQPLHILLIDDDPLLSKSLQDILEGDGHVVTAADGGQKGIDVFSDAQKSDNPFAVVITDLGMPHVDGRRVAAAIKMVSPTTPVILLTGWGKRLLDDGVAPTNVDYVLSKPPRIADIRTALAELSTEPARESQA